MRRQIVIRMCDGKRIVIPEPMDMIITVQRQEQIPISFQMKINKDALTGVQNPFIRRHLKRSRR